MKKTIFMVLMCITCAGTTMQAGMPQEIELISVNVYTPLGGPGIETGNLPPCQICFAATITDNVLNVFNRSDEEAVVVITDVDTESVVLSTDLADELEQMLPAGNYQVEIIPENYAPLQGFFEVE